MLRSASISGPKYSGSDTPMAVSSRAIDENPAVGTRPPDRAALPAKRDEGELIRSSCGLRGGGGVGKEFFGRKRDRLLPRELKQRGDMLARNAPASSTLLNGGLPAIRRGICRPRRRRDDVFATKALDDGCSRFQSHAALFSDFPNFASLSMAKFLIFGIAPQFCP